MNSRRPSKRVLLLSLAICGINACSFLGGSDVPNYGPTLADLEEPVVPDDPRPVPPATMDKIEESYRSALLVAKDPGVRHQILVRLADLEMVRSEDRQLTATEQKEYFTGAVDMYQELIKLNDERPIEGESLSNERLLYQLSKAYALDGKLEASNEALKELVSLYPESAFAAEAEFRSAESAFSDGDYKLAEKLYAEVMAAGKETPFYDNAVYMHGWSLFKQNRYRDAINSFTEVLDRSLTGDKKLSDLSNSHRNLVDDTLRVMAIVFSYLEGAKSIAEMYEGIGLRHYNHMLYMRLGDLYLEQKRYKDSADTYRYYVKYFPNTDQSPAFTVKAIDVYKQGGFPELVLPAKEEYIRTYGVYSEFWKVRNEEQRAYIIPNLKLFLDEISSFYHSRAQKNQKLEKQYLASKTKKKPAPSKPDFIKAADYYGEYTVTFPKDKKTPEMQYLMAEALFDAGNKADAVRAYEKVAYTYLDPKRGADAGYEALLTLDDLIAESTDPAVKAKWAEKKVLSGLNYADYYPNDKRSSSVLAKASQEVFESGDMARSAEIAIRVTTLDPPPEPKLLRTAWLVVAHSRFDLKLYREAEVAYRKALTLLPKDNKPETVEERKKISDRIAASMYRSSEAQVAGGDVDGAVAKLLQIRDLAPGSDIGVKAQYDAANYLIDQKNWAKAETVLKDFETRYPKHELTASIPAKLAFVYQESEQWGKAATALGKMAKSGDPEVKRDSLFLSAELYEKSGNPKKALDQYRKYANTYPEPFDIATEARFKLVELYKKTGNSANRNFWLKKLIDENRKAGSRGTVRSQYLAAFASSEFADQEFERYKRIKIGLPLKQSMQKKKKALDKTLSSYKTVMDYGVAEFATEANYKVGLIYSQLSQDLMNSERPKGLDATAMEQYEILLEEQAYPFEEKSIDIHKSNAERSWKGIYDDGVKNSFKALAKLLPARYGKKEEAPEISRGIH